MAYEYSGFGGLVEDTRDKWIKEGEQAALNALPAELRDNPLAKKAYALAFSSAKAGLDQLSRNPAAQRAAQVTNGLLSTGGDVFNYANKFSSKKYFTDASGVVDFSKDTYQLLNSLVTFAKGVGLPPKVGDEILSWAGIGVGCAASIAAGAAGGIGVGAVGGAVACGLMLAVKIFGAFAAKETVLGPDVPRTMLFTSAQKHLHLMIDGMRLAKCLKSHYGVSSYRNLKSRMNVQWLESGFPARPTEQPGGGWAAKSGQVGAHNFWTLLAMFTPPGAPQDNLEDALALIANMRMRTAPGGRMLFHRYWHDHDIDVAAIELGAYLARSSIAATGSPALDFSVSCTSQLDDGWRPGQCSFGEKSERHRRDFSAFMHVDELLEYFACITIRELDEGLDVVKDYVADGVPIRHVMVATADRAGEPDEIGSRGWSEKCWTNLESVRGADGDCRLALIRAVRARNPRAIKEFAGIRLASAMSYIHLYYKWTEDAQTINDIVALMATPSPDPLMAKLQQPVDPRQAVQVSPGRWKLRPEDHPVGDPDARAGGSIAQAISDISDPICRRDTTPPCRKSYWCNATVHSSLWPSPRPSRGTDDGYPVSGVCQPDNPYDLASPSNRNGAFLARAVNAMEQTVGKAWKMGMADARVAHAFEQATMKALEQQIGTVHSQKAALQTYIAQRGGLQTVTDIEARCRAAGGTPQRRPGDPRIYCVAQGETLQDALRREGKLPPQAAGGAAALAPVALGAGALLLVSRFLFK